MTHQLVKSTNVYSIAHEGDKMEARFKCGWCCGSGNDLTLPPTGFQRISRKCKKCEGRGHSVVYQYEGVDAATFAKVAESSSVGSAFHLLIKGKFKATKLP